MGRPIKKRRAGRAPKSINIKNPDVLRLLKARADETGLGYTEVLRMALTLGPPVTRTPEQIARINAVMERLWQRSDTMRADYAARGAPVPTSDHADLYDESGLPK